MRVGTLLSCIYLATYQPPVEKIVTLTRAITQLDLAKFFFSISWESQVVPDNHYVKLSADFDEIGRMLGGWKKGLETKNSR